MKAGGTRFGHPHILFLLASFLLTACAVEIERASVDVWLESGEKWRASSSVDIAADDFRLYGPQVQAALEEVVDEIRNAGASEATLSGEALEDEGLVRFTVESEGVGWDTLNRAIFDQQGLIVADETQRGLLFFVMEDSDEFLAGAGERVLTLHGARVFDSNGAATNDTVVWRNPQGRLEALLLPANPRLTYGGYALIGAGVLLMLGGVVLLRRPAGIGTRQPMGPTAPASAPGSQPATSPGMILVCPECPPERSFPEGARFCPDHGQPLQEAKPP